MEPLWVVIWRRLDHASFCSYCVTGYNRFQEFHLDPAVLKPRTTKERSQHLYEVANDLLALHYRFVKPCRSGPFQIVVNVAHEFTDPGVDRYLRLARCLLQRTDRGSGYKPPPSVLNWGQARRTDAGYPSSWKRRSPSTDDITGRCAIRGPHDLDATMSDKRSAVWSRGRRFHHNVPLIAPDVLVDVTAVERHRLADEDRGVEPELFFCVNTRNRLSVVVFKVETQQIIRE